MTEKQFELVMKLTKFAEKSANCDLALQLALDAIQIRDDKVADGEDIGNPDGYAYTVLRGKLVNHRRKAQRHALNYSASPVEEVAAGGPSHVEKIEMRDFLKVVFSKFTGKQQSALAMIVAGMPVGEVAEVLGINRITLRRKRDKLRAIALHLAGEPNPTTAAKLIASQRPRTMAKTAKRNGAANSGHRATTSATSSGKSARKPAA